MSDSKAKGAADGANARYVDPNSGAAAQPGGYAHAPVVDDNFDAAVADSITDEQDAAQESRKEAGVKDKEQDKKAAAARKAASTVRVQDEKTADKK